MSRPGRGRAVFGAVRFGLPDEQRSQRRERVVGDLARPHEIPERGEQLGVGGVGRRRAQLGPERRASLRQRCSRTASCTRPLTAARSDPSDGSSSAPGRGRTGATRPSRAPIGPCTDPHDIAGGAQRVEVRGRVARAAAPRSTSVSSADATIGAPCSCPSTSTRPSTPCRAPVWTPCHASANRAYASRSTGSTSRRSDGQRSAPQLAEHVDVTPLALDAVGPELTADDSTLGLERRRATATTRWTGAPKPARGRRREERAVGGGIAGDEVVERVLGRLGADRRQARAGSRRRARRGGVRHRSRPRSDRCHRSRTAIARRVSSSESIDGSRTSSARARTRGRARRTCRSPSSRSRSCTSSASRAGRFGDEALEVELEVGEHARVDELAQLLGAHRVAEQVAVERQRGGPTLGERRVVLVHVGGDPSEEQRLRERRGPRRLDRHHPDRPRRGARSAPCAARARRTRLAGTRVSSRAAPGTLGCFDATARRSAARWRCCHRRRALTGPAARAAAASAPRTRGTVDAKSDDVGSVDTTRSSISSGAITSSSIGRSSTASGKAQHDAVVGPHHLDRQAQPLVEASTDRDRPRRVHPRAERREHAHAPVADLVAEALDDDRAVVGHRAPGLGLLADVPQHVVGRPGCRARGRP